MLRDIRGTRKGCTPLMVDFAAEIISGVRWVCRQVGQGECNQQGWDNLPVESNTLSIRSSWSWSLFPSAHFHFRPHWYRSFISARRDTEAENCARICANRIEQMDRRTESVERTSGTKIRFYVYAIQWIRNTVAHWNLQSCILDQSTIFGSFSLFSEITFVIRR